jgi:hypothetical protein
MATWQSAKSTINKSQWTLSTRLLVPTKVADGIPGYKVPYKVHPWLVGALQEQVEWVANRDRAKLLTRSPDGKYRKLEKSVPDNFEPGDIIVARFAIAFSVRAANWAVEVIPGELIRVGKAALKAPGSSIDIEYTATESDEEEEEGDTVTSAAPPSPEPSTLKRKSSLSTPERRLRRRDESPAWEMEEVDVEHHSPAGSSNSGPVMDQSREQASQAARANSRSLRSKLK